MIFITLLSAFFLFSSNLLGEVNSIRFEHLNARNGLSQGHVLCMIQDSEGYIWAGTYHGLNRYNGYDFKVFTADKSNPNSMFINVVFSLYEDRDGRIWMGTWGIDIYDKKKESFTHIIAYEGDNALSAGEVSCMIQDKDGNMWVGTKGGGINKIEYGSMKITHFRAEIGNKNKLNSDFINDVIIDDEERLWIATEGGGLSILNLDDESIQSYRENESGIGILSDKITAIHKDKAGNIWVGDAEGNLLKYQPEQNLFARVDRKVTQSGVNLSRISAIDEDKNNNLLLATDGTGLHIFNPLSGDNLVNIHNTENPSSISSNESRSLLVDKNYTVFVGSFGRGISKYSPYNRKFEVHSIYDSKSKNSDINSFTNAIEDRAGNLVAGTYDGFFVFNQTDWSYKHYRPGNDYRDNKILKLKLAPDNTIWISSVSKLYRYDERYNLIQTYILDSNLIDHSIYSMEFDHLNNLWIALFTKALLKIPESEWSNRSNKKLNYSSYRIDYSDSTSISGDQNWEIYSDKNSNLWIGGVGGLCQYNYAEDNFIRYFSDASVKSLRFDSKDRLWLTTIGEGLFLYDLEDRSYERFTTKNGLSHSFIYGILVDRNDDIWLNTESGLSRFNIESKNFRNYDERDGLPSNHFDDKSEAMISGNRFYMGTINGFIIFNPDSIIDDTSSAKVVLTSLTINNEIIKKYQVNEEDSTLILPIEQVTKIDLEPDQRDLILEFATLHYSAPHKIRYKYKLSGFDKDWIQTSSDFRYARYTNLDAGEYNFIVRSTNGDGSWVNEPMVINLIVHPKFYETVLFKSLAIIALLTMIYIGFAMRIRNILKQKTLLKNEVILRTSELEGKNVLLEKRTVELKELNTQLEERQTEIESQKNQLLAQKEELTALNLTKDKLFSIVAHDLKNPFHVILGYTDLLIDQYKSWDDEKKIQFLNLLRDSTQSAYRLLENLLHWSKSQMGSVVLNPILSTAEILVNEVLADVNSFATKKGIIIQKEIEKNELMVYSDPDMISLVLRNLLSNAIKFSEKNSKILISVRENKSKLVQFSIKDFGVGISEEEINNIFSLEENKSKLGTYGEKGTGLGLILCKEFVEMHKGEIWVESKIGIGTIFHFTLPKNSMS